MRSLDVGYVPSLFIHVVMRRRKNHRPTEERIAHLERLFAAGRDLWTGEPLEGDEARDWRHLQNPRPGRPSRHVRCEIA